MSKREIRKISQPDLVLESKRTKRIRITVCVFYIVTMVWCALPFVQLPAPDGSIQFFTVFNMIFDGLCLTGILCPIIAVALICFGPGRAFSLGALLSMICYFVITFMSVYLFLVKQEEKRCGEKVGNDPKPKHDFKIEK